jgi:hypothetical protein
MEQNAQNQQSPSKTRRIVRLFQSLRSCCCSSFCLVCRQAADHTLKDPSAFRDWIDARGVWGKLIFIGMCILQSSWLYSGEPSSLRWLRLRALEGTLLVWTGLVLGTRSYFSLCANSASSCRSGFSA